MKITLHVPNKDIAPCKSMLVDVKANLEVWRRVGMGLLDIEEGVIVNGGSLKAKAPKWHQRVVGLKWMWTLPMFHLLV